MLTGRKRWADPRWLMILAIAGVTGFQFYWLYQNYLRERNSLSLRTNQLFQETVFGLQQKSLRLDRMSIADSPREKVAILIEQHDEEPQVHSGTPHTGVLNMINVLRSRVADSPGRQDKVIERMELSAVRQKDSTVYTAEWETGGKQMVRFLASLDSLQDSLRTSDIVREFDSTLQQEKLRIPFQIHRKDSGYTPGSIHRNEITVGFRHPVTYKLELGNTLPYLLGRLWPPILFSVILVGLTLLSFVLLFRSLRQQERLAALKNEFISNMTHELKTPIATAGVALESLQHFHGLQDPVKTSEYLDMARQELARLSMLTEQVLRTSRMEEGQFLLQNTELDLNTMVRDICASFRPLTVSGQAHIETETRGSRFIVKGDKLSLSTVVYNLLDNAIKYGGQGTHISVVLEEREKHIILSVRDQGPGIPEAYRKKIFTKFFRLPHGDVHDVKGYGLGLYHVAQIVSAHGGKVTQENNPAGGTTFTICLPSSV